MEKEPTIKELKRAALETKDSLFNKAHISDLHEIVAKQRVQALPNVIQWAEEEIRRREILQISEERKEDQDIDSRLINKQIHWNGTYIIIGAIIGALVGSIATFLLTSCK